MKFVRTKSISFFVSVVVSLSTCSAYAAIALDRTRAIFPGTEKTISLNIQNESNKQPYLAQAWLEDMQGNKIESPFSITPPLQRVEPGAKSVVRINAITSAISNLPQDRESVFYFNLREIPPKSTRANVLQVALHSKIKLFYRPASIIPAKFGRLDDKLVLHKVNGGYEVENPTPYFMTVVGITGSKNGSIPKDAKPVMISPMSKSIVRSAAFTSPHVMTINDFGGKPVLKYECSGNTCHSVPEDKKS